MKYGAASAITQKNILRVYEFSFFPLSAQQPAAILSAFSAGIYFRLNLETARAGSLLSTLGAVIS